MKVEFFKQDNKWYADVPNHTLEENEMVFGADTLLDMIANNRTRIGIDLSDTYDKDKSALLVLKLVEHDEDGGLYNVIGGDYQFNTKVPMQAWFCNVTHDVFKEHPQEIVITNVETIE